MGAPPGFRLPLAVGVALLGGGLILWSGLSSIWPGAPATWESQGAPQLDQAHMWPEGDGDDEKLGIEGDPWATLSAVELEQLKRINVLIDISNTDGVTAGPPGMGGLEALDSLGLHSPDTQAAVDMRESWDEDGGAAADDLFYPNFFRVPKGDDLPRATQGMPPAAAGPEGRRLSVADTQGFEGLKNPLGLGRELTGFSPLGRANPAASSAIPGLAHHPNAQAIPAQRPPTSPGMGTPRTTGGNGSGSGDARNRSSGSPGFQWLPQGNKAPHEYYYESKHTPPIRGLRWTPDPRVLQPEILRDLVKEPGVAELVKERALWQSAYGFDKELTVNSTIRKGNKFKIVFTDVLGSGGIGVVLSAIDVTNNRRIAIKVCRLQKHSHRGHHYDQDILRRRVQQEIALWKYVPQAIDLQQWSQISQIVIPIDMVEPTERVAQAEEDSVKYSHEWVIFDVFAGDLLSIDSIWNGTMVTKIEVTKQVIYATMSLHAMGLVHSDIKPPNFLVHHDGHIYLGDNGLCTPVNHNTECLNGTVHYLPPENMRCQIYQKRRILTSERKDSWAVGVVLFRLFCSTLPFDVKGMWPSDVALTIGNATANDLDFTGCHPDTPVLILGLIRLLLTPTVTLRPTLRDLYLNHPLFGLSNTAIAAGKRVRDVEKAVVKEYPALAKYVSHH